MAGIQKITSRKGKAHYWVSYKSVLDGKRKRVPKKVTGILPTKESVTEWIEKHMADFLAKENAMLEKHQWRSTGDMILRYDEFKAYKKLHQPNSYQVTTSSLKNYVLPYFMTECGHSNPNHWHNDAQRFKSWLITEAASKSPNAMAVGTANTAINAYNKFCEWLRDHAKVLDFENCRPLIAYEGKLLNRRGAKDLVDEQEFTMVAAQLRTFSELYADVWLVQRHTGMRVGELCGLSLKSVATALPPHIIDEFKDAGVTQFFGSVYLDSQPRDAYVKRYNEEIPRKPLKGRDEISPKCARTIPISDKNVWNILATRHGIQKELHLKLAHGPDKESYILFDGMQTNHYLEALRQVYKLIGLRAKTSHSLRHTRATELTQMKISDKVQELVLGHKGLAQQRYQHIVEVINRQTQEDLDYGDIKIVV